MIKHYALLFLATLFCCVRGFMLEAQESIEPLSYCSQDITLEAPIQPHSQSNLTASEGMESVEFLFSHKEQIRSIYALAVDISATFYGTDGYFSILFEDQEGKQYLVYRDIACFNQQNIPINLTLKSFETALFVFGVQPKKLILNTTGCQVEIKKVHTSFTPLERMSAMIQYQRFSSEKERVVQMQINRINQYNKEHQILWIAKETPLSNLSYTEIRNTFSSLNELEAYGLEHYGGGIYTPMAFNFDQLEFLDTTTAPYVENFDWKNRHGINWNSPCRWQQGNHCPDTETCWAQAPASALEGYIKRYYGKDKNDTVSILQIIACSGGLVRGPYEGENCGGGSTFTAAMYLAKEPIVSEDDFPFTDKKYQPCENKPTNPKVSYQVERVQQLSSNFNREQVMHTLINKGPMIASVLTHSMLLSGYGVVKPGLMLDYWPKHPIPITEDHPLCGKVYWSFKNSFGEGFGNGGYNYFIRVKHKPVDAGEYHKMCVPKIYGLYYLSGKLTKNDRSDNNQCEPKAYDADGDGYYRWGLIGRPQNDKFIPEEQDGDDSDPLAGPMNEYGFCKELRKTDLYIRDVDQDKGVEPYLIDAPQWESPDIWVRQSNDSIEMHQNPNFSNNNNCCYVYLRIHNKGTKPSNQRAMVRLYWSYSSPTQWWESFHGKEQITLNGQNLDSGGEVGAAVIPSIPAGESAIIEIKWKLPSKLLYSMNKKELHACLMAEIADMQDPYYMADHSDFRKYIQANNNVAQKNMHIIDVSDDTDDDNPFDNITDIIISNHSDKDRDLRFIIDYDDNLNDYATIKDQLELSYHCAPTYAIQSEELNYQPIDFQSVDSVAVTDNIHLTPNEQRSFKLKTNFLVQKQTDQNEFKVRVQAVDANTGKNIGGNTYIIRKSPRPLFSADVTIIDDLDEGTKLIAHDIGEPVKYSWSTSEGKKIAVGKKLSIPSNTQLKNVTLSVETSKDGFIDRRTVSLPQRINIETSPIKTYPNPTDGMLTIQLLEAKQNGIITITSAESGKVCYTIPTHGERTLTANLSAFPRGNYFLNYYDGVSLIATQEIHKL